MLNITSKFYPNSFGLPVLELIKNGRIAADIARTLNISQPLVRYYISKAKKCGYVKEGVRDVFKSYELTQAGKNFLDQYGHNSTSPLLLCRGENIQFIADVVQMPTIPVDWKKVQMNNWVQYKSQIDEVRVRLNNGKSPTLEFLPSPVESKDPFDVYIIMVVDIANVILELERKFGLRVERLRLGSRGEWLVYDALARFFCKTNGQVTYKGIAKVNASKPRSFGEFEFFDPRTLRDYLLMPPRVDRIDTRTERIEAMLIEYTDLTKTLRQVTLPSIITMFFLGAYARWVPLFIF